MTLRHGPLQRSMIPATGVFMALGAVGAAFAFTEGEDVTEAPAQTATLGYKSLKRWDIVVPNELWSPVEKSIPIPHAGGSGFLVEQTGQMKLRVDANGDGRLDTDVRGSSGFLNLRAKDEDGTGFTYAVRFVMEGGKYRFAPSGAMFGKVGGSTIKVIDRNGNGRYDDYGQDAIVVGGTSGASLLSRVINADGELYTFDISPDGTKVEYRPYTGPTATVDMTSKHGCSGDLVSAVIGDRKDDHYFNAARGKGAMKVPAGDYELVYGFAARGQETVQIRGGKMLAVKLNQGDSRVVEWGGPIVAEFDHVVSGETITVRPNVAFYGQLGEEYHTFKPDAKSPKIIVADKNSKEVYDQGFFGGC